VSKIKSCLVSLLADQGFPRAEIPWDKMLRISDYSKAGPLLFSKIKDGRDKSRIPPEIFSKLEHQHRINLIRNTLLLEEFAKLSALLRQEEVDHLLLKGIFLLHTVYREQRALRRLEDVDILIKEQDVKKTGQLLLGLGYKALPEPHQERKTTMYSKAGTDGSVFMPVHLHWHIANFSRSCFYQECNSIDINEIWNNSRALNGDGSLRAFIMSPEHALLALCEHSFRHAYSRLMLLYDIHLHIKESKDSLNWDRLLSCASSWGLDVPLYLGLVLSQEMFGTVIPDGFMRRLRPKTSCWEKLFLKYARQSDFPSEEVGVLLYLAAKRNLRDKARFLWRCAFPMLA
jgi:hypothetical protein